VLKKSLILLPLVVMACAQAEKAPEEHQNWILKSSNPDQKLKVDEQFLNKAQKGLNTETAATRGRKIYLNP
jgi:macrodomain Ter protein organizer (MatP/YcbG family)